MRAHLFVVLCFLFSFAMAASNSGTGNFCCENGNAQEALVKSFTTKNAPRADFSIPPGVYRNASSNCRYDGQNLCCNTQDQIGRRSYYLSCLHVRDNTDIYVDRNGNLQNG